MATESNVKVTPETFIFRLLAQQVTSWARSGRPQSCSSNSN
jgi:hypothetical protein